jgi:hypothetical protein
MYKAQATNIGMYVLDTKEKVDLRTTTRFIFITMPGRDGYRDGDIVVIYPTAAGYLAAKRPHSGRVPS